MLDFDYARTSPPSPPSPACTSTSSIPRLSPSLRPLGVKDPNALTVRMIHTFAPDQRISTLRSSNGRALRLRKTQPRPTIALPFLHPTRVIRDSLAEIMQIMPASEIDDAEPIDPGAQRFQSRGRGTLTE